MEEKEARGGNLVISRRVGRGVYIGRGITVTVVGVEGSMVELAIEAPKDCAVTRDDFAFDIHLEHQKAREDGVRINDHEARSRARQARLRGAK